MLTVVIDADSMWPEIFVMENTNVDETVSKPHSLFVRMKLLDVFNCERCKACH